VQVSPESIPRAAQIAVDGQVLGFTFLTSLLTGLVFGLLPAFQAAKPNLNELLKSTTAGGSRHFVRSLLVVFEVALSLVLLTGAGLLIKSFLRLREVNPGFNPQHVLTLQVNLPPAKYREDAQRAEFLKQALQRIRTLAGVEAAGATTTLPFVGDNLNGFVIEGRAALAPNEVPSANYYAVSPDYFRALGIPLLQGRYFTDRDASDAPHVVVINETLARRYFPNENPVGRRMRITDRTTTMREIVGVVGDVRQYGMEGAQTAQMHEPYLQNPLNFITLAVRTTGDPVSLAGAVRKQVFAVDQDQPVSNVKTMEQIISDSVAPRRLTMMLLGVFAAVALLLAAVGIYGLMSHAVGQRKHEIGVRLALGGRPRDVFKLVMGQGLMLALVGVVVGLAASFALTRVMTRLLYGVSARDLLTFGLVSLLLIAVAWLASYIPARRAAKVEPMEALRCE
jgi:putative ABC transport system permease protein